MDTAVAFLCTNYNKYSINALAGALESSPATVDAKTYFIREKVVDKIVQALDELLEKHEHVLACASFATTNIAAVYKLLEALKAYLGASKLTLIAGGPHASGDPAGTLLMGFDIVAIGEAEETFPELVATFKSGDDWRSVKGIAYRDDVGDVIRTGRRRPVDLNRFAPFSLKHKRLSPIEISRGCPHACRFCQTSRIFSAKMRHRSLEEIIKYISLSRAKGTKDFRFISPNALAYGSVDGKTPNLAAVEGLLVEASKIVGKEHLFFGSFPSEVRPEAVSKEALHLIRSYTATKQIVVGAQTGSQRMLDLLHREHSPGDVMHAAELILAAGLEVSVDFIFGLPGEAHADRELSVKMMDRLAALGAKIHSHTFIPLPGTPLAKANAGSIGEDLAVYLSRLANKGLQFGQWKKQEKLAHEATSLMQSIKA